MHLFIFEAQNLINYAELYKIKLLVVYIYFFNISL